MPLSDIQKQQLILNQGLDPKQWQVSPDESQIIPLSQQQQAAILEQPTVGPRTQTPKLPPTTPDQQQFSPDSPFMTFGKSALQGIPSALGGLGGMALGEAALAPVAPPVGPVVGAVAGAYGGSKIADWLREKIEPQEWQQNVAASQQENPIAGTLGNLASMLAGGFKPNPKALGPAAGDLMNLLVGNTVKNPRNLVNVAGGAGLGMGMGALDSAIQGKVPNWQDLLLNAGAGALFNSPNALGRKVLGIPANKGALATDPYTRLQQEQVLVPNNGKQQGPPTVPFGGRMADIIPLDTQGTVINQQGKVVPFPSEMPETTSPLKQNIEQRFPITKPKSAEESASVMQSAQAQLEAQRAHIESLKQQIQTEQRAQQIAEAERQMKELQVQLNWQMAEAARQKQQSLDEFNAARNEAQTENYSPEAAAHPNKPLDPNAIRISANENLVGSDINRPESFDRTKYQPASNLPEGDDVPPVVKEWRKYKPTTKWFQILNDWINQVKGVKTAVGDIGSNAGQYDPNTRTITLGKTAAADTQPHELMHGFLDALRSSDRPYDQRLVQQYDKIVSDSPEYKQWKQKMDEKSIADGRKYDTSPEEYQATQAGHEFVARHLNLRGEKPIQTWWNDFNSYIKTRFGKHATIDDFKRLLNYRMSYENKKFGSYFGDKGIGRGGATIPVRNQPDEGLPPDLNTPEGRAEQNRRNRERDPLGYAFGDLQFGPNKNTKEYFRLMRLQDKAMNIAEYHDNRDTIHNPAIQEILNERPKNLQEFKDKMNRIIAVGEQGTTRNQPSSDLNQQPGEGKTPYPFLARDIFEGQRFETHTELNSDEMTKVHALARKLQETEGLSQPKALANAFSMWRSSRLNRAIKNQPASVLPTHTQVKDLIMNGVQGTDEATLDEPDLKQIVKHLKDNVDWSQGFPETGKYLHSAQFDLLDPDHWKELENKYNIEQNKAPVSGTKPAISDSDAENLKKALGLKEELVKKEAVKEEVPQVPDMEAEDALKAEKAKLFNYETQVLDKQYPGWRESYSKLPEKVYHYWAGLQEDAGITEHKPVSPEVKHAVETPAVKPTERAANRDLPVAATEEAKSAAEAKRELTPSGAKQSATKAENKRMAQIQETGKVPFQESTAPWSDEHMEAWRRQSKLEREFPVTAENAQTRADIIREQYKKHQDNGIQAIKNNDISAASFHAARMKKLQMDHDSIVDRFNLDPESKIIRGYDREGRQIKYQPKSELRDPYEFSDSIELSKEFAQKHKSHIDHTTEALYNAVEADPNAFWEHYQGIVNNRNEANNTGEPDVHSWLYRKMRDDLRAGAAYKEHNVVDSNVQDWEKVWNFTNMVRQKFPELYFSSADEAHADLIAGDHPVAKKHLERLGYVDEKHYLPFAIDKVREIDPSITSEEVKNWFNDYKNWGRKEFNNVRPGLRRWLDNNAFKGLEPYDAKNYEGIHEQPYSQLPGVRDLRKEVIDWLVNEKEKPSHPTILYRGTRNKNDYEPSWEHYQHATPWRHIAERGGGFAGTGGFNIHQYPAGHDQLYFRGGSLAGDPLESTDIGSMRGYTWDKALDRTKQLYDRYLNQKIESAKNEGLDLNEQVSKHRTLLEEYKGISAQQALGSLINGTFETDVLNKYGKWTTGMPAPRELKGYQPGLRTNDEVSQWEKSIGNERYQPYSQLPGVRPELELIKELGPEGEQLAKAIEGYYPQKDQIYGKGMHPILKAAKGLNRTDLLKVENILKNENRDKQDYSYLLNGRQKNLYDAIRQSLVDKQNDQIAANQPVTAYRPNGQAYKRLPQVDPFYFPNRIDPRIVDTLMDPKQRPAVAQLKQDFIQHQINQGVSPAIAAEKLKSILTAYDKSDPNMTKFNANREQQGVGLPESWMRKGRLLQDLSAYYNRVSADRAFHDNIEKNPDVAKSAFGLEKDPWGNPYNTQAQDISGAEHVKDLAHRLHGEGFDVGERKLKGFNRIATSLMLGPLTNIHIMGSSIANALQYASPTQAVGGMVHAITHMTDGIQHALENGYLRKNLSGVRDILDSQNTFLERLAATSNGISKLGGRDAVNTLTKGYLQSFGEYLLKQKVVEANAGSKQAQRLLENIDPQYTVGKNYSSNDLSKLASNFASIVHGAHDTRTLPSWMLKDTAIQPFFSLASWNIAQTNAWMRHVWSPAVKDGNFVPLIMSTLGATAGGYLIKEAREKLADKKSPIPSLAEIVNSSKGVEGNIPNVAYNLMAMSSYVGYAGILSVLSKAVEDMAHKNIPQGAAFPLDELISNPVHRASQFVSAAMNDENFDFVNAGTRFVTDLVKENFQLGRLATSWAANLNEIPGLENEHYLKELNRKNTDLRRFEMVEGMPYEAQSPSTANPYMDMDEKMFKRTSNLSEAAQQLPDLIQEAFSKFNKSGGNIAVLKAEMQKIKQNSYETMPDPEKAPQTFIKYMALLSKTQGPEVASARYLDWLYKNHINKVKSQMVPSL